MWFIVVNDQSDPVTGMFTTGTVFTFGDNSTVQISYTGNFATLSTTGGNDIVIHNFQPVPEPGTVLGVAALALAAAGGWSRRRAVMRSASRA